jgi:hypothetical protein
VSIIILMTSAWTETQWRSWIYYCGVSQLSLRSLPIIEYFLCSPLSLSKRSQSSYFTFLLVIFWLGLARKPLALAWLWVALASGILRPSHRCWLWPGFGLAWPEPWPERWLCDKPCILQGVKPGAPPNTGRVSCSESGIE